MEAFLKLAGVILLMIVGFKGAVGILPNSWSYDYEGLTALGAWVGIVGSLFITGTVLSGLKHIQSGTAEIRHDREIE